MRVCVYVFRQVLPSPWAGAPLPCPTTASLQGECLCMAALTPVRVCRMLSMECRHRSWCVNWAQRVGARLFLICWASMLVWGWESPHRHISKPWWRAHTLPFAGGTPDQCHSHAQEAGTYTPRHAAPPAGDAAACHATGVHSLCGVPVWGLRPEAYGLWMPCGGTCCVVLVQAKGTAVPLHSCCLLPGWRQSCW
jgi:hypothetical protein